MSPLRLARTAGVFYVVTILAGLFAEIGVRGRLIVPNDAAATAQNILASETLFRLGFAADLVGGAAYVVVTLLLYELLKPVSRPVALLSVLFSLAGSAIGATSAVAHIAPLLLLKGATYLNVFSGPQLQAMALFLLKLHQQGLLVALIFFGCYCLLLGWLIFKSTFMPRTVGVLIAISGAALLANSFGLFVAPPIGNAVNTYVLALDGLGEIALTVWLLVMGVNVAKWEALANGSR
ncbi:MAG TPA: DUF4386 domain-containing protein [Candidatus Baltobacteraceae bacterium]|jgi:hypothetical protein|nr:DUF4386 domain-containing protein [Candidatus Baltobacteraceae bacterium]